MDKNSIWCEEQNKPSLIVKDLEGYVSANIIYTSLLRRGVFKWLSARRKVIRLKNIWKDRVTESLSRQKLSSGPTVNYWRGYRKGVEQCRKELRAICHGPRWEAPDFDTKAQEWLQTRDKRGG